MVTTTMRGLGDTNVVSGFNAYSFLSSAGGLDNQNFVISLYRQALGRQPGTGEISGWVQALTNGQSRYDVINQFVSSPEFFQAAQAQSSGTDTARTYLLTQSGGSGLVPAPIVSPSTTAQVAAANATTQSGDTTNTSSSTLASFTDMFTGETSIAGYQVPTLALIAAAAGAYYLFVKRGR